MSGTLHRREAAAWLGIGEHVIRHWERRRVTRAQRPGVRRPASYGLRELVLLHVLGELRRTGTNLATLRRARLAIEGLEPPIHEWPAGARLLVTEDAEVARINTNKALAGRTRSGGTFALFEPRRIARLAEGTIRARA